MPPWVDCLCVNDAHIFLHMFKIQICSYSELKQLVLKTWIYMQFDLGWTVPYVESFSQSDEKLGVQEKEPP